jgi:hypothetical protein
VQHRRHGKSSDGSRRKLVGHAGAAAVPLPAEDRPPTFSPRSRRRARRPRPGCPVRRDRCARSRVDPPPGAQLKQQHATRPATAVRATADRFSLPSSWPRRRVTAHAACCAQLLWCRHVPRALAQGAPRHQPHGSTTLAIRNGCDQRRNRWWWCHKAASIIQARWFPE